eukprot:scaffold52335_cov61-Phaeocystis_antarctica.AAC.6
MCTAKMPHNNRILESVLSCRWQGRLGPATHTPTTQRRQRDHAAVQGSRPVHIRLARHGARGGQVDLGHRGDAHGRAEGEGDASGGSLSGSLGGQRRWHDAEPAASAASTNAAAEAAVIAGASMVDGGGGEGGGEGGGLLLFLLLLLLLLLSRRRRAVARA